MANQEMRTPLAEPLAPTTIADDQPCAKCGYNLRSLSVTGRCSECGLPVEASLSTILKPGLSQKRLRRAISILVLAISLGVAGPLLYMAFILQLYFATLQTIRGVYGVVVPMIFFLGDICGILLVLAVIELFQALRSPSAGRRGSTAFYAWMLLPGYSLFLSTVGYLLGKREPAWYQFLLFHVPSDAGKPALWIAMVFLLWRLQQSTSVSASPKLVFATRAAILASFLLCISAVAQPIYFRVTSDPLFENVWWRASQLYYWSGNGRIEFLVQIILLGSLLHWLMALRLPGRADCASAER